MKKIAKNQIETLLQALAPHMDLYVPVSGAFTRTSQLNLWQEGLGNASQFRLYEEGLPLHWSSNTCLSPKNALLPQSEKLYTTITRGKSMEIHEEPGNTKPLLLFGIRSCDVEGIGHMDRVFLQKGFEDTSYKNRREKTIIFALGCSTHEDTCFCTSMGIDPQTAPTADVQMSDLSDAFGFTPKTARGNQILQFINNMLTEIGAARPEPTEPMLIQVPVSGISDKLETMFDHPIWDDLSPLCIGCGTCTFICPTCVCFDINNKYPSQSVVNKQRCWDSCMFNDYAVMAGGHNPRPTKKERVRNRFLDKLLYSRQRYGHISCVGCGRCVAKCPVSLEIATTITKIQAAEVKP